MSHKTNDILLNIVNIESILNQDTPVDKERWESIIQKHPADIADLVEKIDKEYRVRFIKMLPHNIDAEIFEHLNPLTQAHLLANLDTKESTHILRKMSVDELTDLFELLPDTEVKKYLKLLQAKQRKQVISLLNFDSESAGGIMNSDVLSLQTDFTIKKSIDLLQKIRPRRERNEKFYVTDKDNTLVGHIHLADLVLNKPETVLKQIVHKNELQVNAKTDREEVAKQMKHYGLVSVPVVDDKDQFLGLIKADMVFDIIEEETSEDVYKISGVSPAKHTYFQTTFWQLMWNRSPWLVSLLLFQSISGNIMSNYEGLLNAHTELAFFITMLIGTGGNAGNQTGAVVIRGIATGEISRENGMKMLFREFRLSLVLSFLLSSVAYGRVIFTEGSHIIAMAISSSLFLIIILSIMMGALLPLLLDRLNFDPANSAQPFLATLMDITGIFIYCMVASKFLGF